MILRHAPLPVRRAPLLRTLLAGLVAGLLGCESYPEIPEGAFTQPPPAQTFSASKALKEFDADPAEAYRLGEGDQVTIQVWDRPDLSGQQTVGPDGAITIPVAGTISVSGLTREESAKTVKTALSKFYDSLSVTVRVDQYLANRVVVLGRVKTPGVQRFENIPTLLEAISRAGGLSEESVTPTRNLSHCAVLRGRDRVAWLDLRTLMDGGDLSLNLRLKRNDVVMIPDSWDQPVYVLGQVIKPGPVRWSAGMTVVDALALAGGVGRDAASYNISLIRPSKNLRMKIAQGDLLEPVPGANVAVERGDILFVPTSFLADLGYVFEKLDPLGWVFLAGAVK